MGRLKINILLISVFITSIFSLSASIWQRGENVNNTVTIENAFSYNNDLYAQGKSPIKKLFLKNQNKWVNSSNGFLASLERIISLKQVNNVIIVSSIKGNYRSFDNGETWTNIDNLILNEITIIDSNIFAQSPNNNSKLLFLEKNSTEWKSVTYINKNNEIDTVIGDLLAVENKTIVAGDKDYPDRKNTDGGIYISKDGGKTWEKSLTFNNKVISLAIHNNIIFVGASNKHFYRSYDLGKSWVVDTNQIIPIDDMIIFNDNLYAAFNSIALNYEFEAGIHISIDNGETWELIDDGLYNSNINYFVQNENSLYVLSGSHLYELNKNKKWELSNIEFDSISCKDIIKYKDTLFVATYPRGIFYSVDNGKNWEIFNKELENKNIQFFNFIKNDKIFLINDLGNMLRISTDAGYTWINKGIGVSDIQNPPINDVILLDSTILLATDIGTKLSKDKGSTWYNIYGGDLDSGEISYRIYTDDSDIYIYTLKGLLKSQDYGNSWVKFIDIENFIENRVKYIFGFIDKTLYAFDDKYDVIKFDNLNQSWSVIYKNENIKYIPFGLIEFEGNLIMSHGGSVIISNDKGKKWNRYLVDTIHSEDEQFLIRRLVISDNYLIAATDNGVYRAKLSDLDIVKSSVESETERNYLYTYPPYPLPAKSEVKVLFYWDINIPMTVDDISIYDLSGQKIEAKNNLKLIKQESHYGNIIWDCSTTPAGIYLINIKHGTESKSVKVVVE